MLDESCPTLKALGLIANKWTVLVIYALASGTKRYNQLRRLVTGVTHKMLTQTLRDLEAAGMVKREVYPVVPPRVEYSLTPLGTSLSTPLNALYVWAQENLETIQAAS